jgi:hypothetical protein
VLQVSKERPQGSDEYFPVTRAEIAYAALKEGRNVRCAEMCEIQSARPKACGQELIDVRQVIAYGSRGKTALFQKVPTVLCRDLLLGRRCGQPSFRGGTPLAKHAQQAFHSGGVVALNLVRIPTLIQESLDYALIQIMQFAFTSSQPLAEPGNQPNLLARGRRQVTLLLDHRKVGIEMLGQGPHPCNCGRV